MPLLSLFFVAAVVLPAQSVHQARPDIPAELRQPLAAVTRIATGLQANQVCNRYSAAERQDISRQLSQAVQTLHNRLVEAGIAPRKSQRILTGLMDEGENLARGNFTTCTTLAPEIMVKAQQDAACINLYLAGSNNACFR